MKVRITPRAQAQARDKRAWWLEHRQDAPSLFDEELEQAVELVREAPGAGVGWPTARNPGLRRVLMPKTRNHLYFFFDRPRMTVVIIAVWGSSRGRGPEL